ncbi:MAG: SDR family NAD(P)-dependent oxidoreductase [Bacteroidota bacterium]
MKTKNVLLSGGHSGMGLELSKILLNEGHHVGLILRSETRKKDAIEALGNSSKIDFFFADLGKRDQIQRVAEEIKSAWSNIDVLFNNAGVLLDKLYYSDYGNELQLEINAISPFLLTKELLSLLEKSESPLVVSTATSGLQKRELGNITQLKNPTKFTKLTGSYMDSKLTMVLLMNYLSVKNSKVRIVSVDPGAIKTKMTAGDGMPFWLKPIRNLLFKSPKQGAENLYDGAFNEKNRGSGIYVSGGKIKKIKTSLNDQQVDELLT